MAFEKYDKSLSTTISCVLQCAYASLAYYTFVSLNYLQVSEFVSFLCNCGHMFYVQLNLIASCGVGEWGIDLFEMTLYDFTFYDFDPDIRSFKMKL